VTPPRSRYPGLLRPSLALVVLSAAACGQAAVSDDAAVPDLAAALDLSVGAATDLAVRDLAPLPPDLLDCTGPVGLDGGFCAGTPLAGTCVESYFATVADCFQASGTCVYDPGTLATCFCDGARISIQGDYTSAGRLCLNQQITCITGSSCITYRPYVFTAPAGVLRWTWHDDGLGPPKNDVVCPGDGGTSQLDPTLCPNVARLIGTPRSCATGSCP
jgi:hypothetical protein